MRLFVAVDLSEALRAEAAAVQQGLRRALGDAAAGVSWIPPERLHLTLRFIGEADDQQIAAIRSALAPAIPEAPFRLTFDGPGMFPPAGRPRVLWLGVRDGAEPLRRVAAAVEARLVQAGLAPEPRALTPHLTLGRFREPGSLADRRRIEGRRAAPEGRCVIDQVTLYRSQLSPRGASYTALQHTLLLGGSEA